MKTHCEIIQMKDNEQYYYVHCLFFKFQDIFPIILMREKKNH